MAFSRLLLLLIQRAAPMASCRPLSLLLRRHKYSVPIAFCRLLSLLLQGRNEGALEAISRPLSPTDHHRHARTMDPMTVYRLLSLIVLKVSLQRLLHSGANARFTPFASPVPRRTSPRRPNAAPHMDAVPSPLLFHRADEELPAATLPTTAMENQRSVGAATRFGSSTTVTTRTGIFVQGASSVTKSSPTRSRQGT
jgi:hypothetical protein